jgi:tRNA threonylcarbamoyladenosine biosynthesis protein TsaE
MKRMRTMDGKQGKRVLSSGSSAETISLGKLIGESVPAGAVISLEGGLGAGKTVMARGICAGAGVADEVHSSSFVLMEEYSGDLDVIHFDLYRLDEFEELDEIGFFDYIDGQNIVLIEWGDRLPRGTVNSDIRVMMKIEDKDRRLIEIVSFEKFLRVIDEWKR